MTRDDLKFYRPCAALPPLYVRSYWVFRSDSALSILIFSVGYPRLIFHKRTPLYIQELVVWQSRMTVSGQETIRRTSVPMATRRCSLSCCGRTHRARFSVSPHRFYNREVAGSDFDVPRLNGMTEQVMECDDNMRCVWLIEQWQLGRLTDGPQDVSGKSRSGTAELNMRRGMPWGGCCAPFPVQLLPSWLPQLVSERSSLSARSSRSWASAQKNMRASSAFRRY